MKNTISFPFFVILIFTLTMVSTAPAQVPPLLDNTTIDALQEELSGELAKRNLEYLTRHHRMRGSSGFRKAAEHIIQQLDDYGIKDAEILQFPADGKTMYGTQKARPAWDAEFAELWELQSVGGAWKPVRRLANWEAMPITLAQDSESGSAQGILVDVGAGTSDIDYEGKAIKGNLVLTSSQPGAIAKRAVKELGAAGIISYAQNQRSAWWKEDENLVRWGHVGSFNDFDAFCFMISLKQARGFRERLQRGETIMLQANVKAGRFEGVYELVSASIEGSNPVLKNEEIVFSCHLDHQMPGANDNISGCVAILEIARTLEKLIEEGKIERPLRTIRFIWPPEIEGTMALLTKNPAWVARMKAAIHMDMVGGRPITKAVFHVSRPPRSLPSFVPDIGEAFGHYLNGQTEAFAGGANVPHPMVAPEGGKEALQAMLGQFSMGSDHDVYNEGSFRVPTIYLHEWPDRYIHTNFDLPAHVDPTKLKRSAFLGAASALSLANMSDDDVPEVWAILQQQALRRTAALLQALPSHNAGEQANLKYHHWRYERAIFESIGNFASIPNDLQTEANDFFARLAQSIGEGQPIIDTNPVAATIYQRSADVRGPVAVFGYNYLSDHYGSEQASKLRLLSFQAITGSSGEYAYEVLNFVDGQRTVLDIRNALSAEFGFIPLDIVAEYLQALESIGLLEMKE